MTAVALRISMHSFEEIKESFASLNGSSVFGQYHHGPGFSLRSRRHTTFDPKAAYCYHLPDQPERRGTNLVKELPMKKEALYIILLLLILPMDRNMVVDHAVYK